jgi:hypothetical protein
VGAAAKRFDVPRPRASDRSGKRERFGAGPLGRIEPVVSQPIQFAGRLRKRLPLLGRWSGEADVLKQAVGTYLESRSKRVKCRDEYHLKLPWWPA